MKFENNKVSDLTVTYIGGGSRGWAWTLMTDLALEPSMSGTVRLYDIDFEAAKKNEGIGNALSAREETIGKWNYEAVADLKTALEGTDFVMISILPGTFEEMASDVHLPERLGIYQSVGDTAGPGGIIRSLRTIPMFIEIAEAVKEYCPNAWVINYTNPMSLCVKTLYHAYPEIKAFGCCHEVFGTQDVLKGIAEEVLGLDKIDRHDIHVNVLGINHFTWFDYASYKSVDLLPIYEEFIAGNFDKGFEGDHEHWANASFGSMNRVKFDLFQEYGLVAAAGDRHLAEFMPGDKYLDSPETVAGWDFGLTTVEWRREVDLVNKHAKSDRLAAGEEQIALKPTGEEGVLLIKALTGLERVISNVNIPNTQLQIANLPATAVVETNAVFDRDSIQPIFAGSIPQNVLELVLPHVENHERTLQAAVNPNKELVVEAFLNDPLVKGKGISEEDVRELVNDMIENTKKYLPDGWN